MRDAIFVRTNPMPNVNLLVIKDILQNLDKISTSKHDFKIHAARCQRLLNRTRPFTAHVKVLLQTESQERASEKEKLSLLITKACVDDIKDLLAKFTVLDTRLVNRVKRYNTDDSEFISLNERLFHAGHLIGLEIKAEMFDSRDDYNDLEGDLTVLLTKKKDRTSMFYSNDEGCESKNNVPNYSFVDSYEIAESQVEFGEVIGSGGFGIVS
jgi:hypothetical protein